MEVIKAKQEDAEIIGQIHSKAMNVFMICGKPLILSLTIGTPSIGR